MSKTFQDYIVFKTSDECLANRLPGGEKYQNQAISILGTDYSTEYLLVYYNKGENSSQDKHENRLLNTREAARFWYCLVFFVSRALKTKPTLSNLS